MTRSSRHVAPRAEAGSPPATRAREVDTSLDDLAQSVAAMAAAVGVAGRVSVVRRVNGVLVRVTVEAA